MLRQLTSNRRQRGAVLVWTAVLLPVLLAFIAVCIDWGIILVTKAQLQAYVDVASLSGAIELPDETAARAAAVDVVTTNDAGAGAALTTGDIEFGSWDRTTRTFTPGVSPADAIRVTAAHDSDHGNPLPLVFLPILGASTADVSAVAISWSVPRLGGPASGGLIGMEWVDVAGTSLIDGYDPTAGPYGGDNAGLPGTVLSNGSMTVRGTPLVTGDARPGVTYTEANVEGAATVEGTTAALTKPLDLAPVVIPTSITSGANDNDLVTGNRNPPAGLNFDPVLGSNDFLDEGPPTTVSTILAGDYYFSNMTVKRTLNITGPAVIRVTGDLTIESTGVINITGGDVEFYVEGVGNLRGQGIVNQSQDPSNLTIYSTGPSLTWNGTSDFYGYLYGPDSPQITIEGSADFYGGAVGRTLSIAGEGDIHTDRGVGFDGPNRKLPLLVD